MINHVFKAAKVKKDEKQHDKIRVNFKTLVLLRSTL